MSLELFIGSRYLKAKRKQAFVSVITLISITGVMIGVMALIVVIGVMAGFEDELKSRILGVNSHIRILKKDDEFILHENLRQKLLKFEKIIGASPYISSQVILRNINNSQGAIIKGINPEFDIEMKDLQKSLKECILQDLQNKSLAYPGIILGKELAKSLEVEKDDSIYIISPRGMISPIGHIPSMKRVIVIGTIDSGMYEYDSSMAILDIENAQKILRMGKSVTGIDLWINDIYNVHDLSKKITNYIGDKYIVKDWIDMNKNLFSALKLEKVTMFLILTLIIIVAAFNITSTLTMMVMERIRDIAILKSMGTKNKTIRKIFMLNGMIIGLVGTIAGIISGLFLCYLLKYYKFIQLPGDVYYITTIPVRLDFNDLLLISFSTLLLSLIATIYPSYHASKLNPLEAIRYE